MGLLQENPCGAVIVMVIEGVFELDAAKAGNAVNEESVSTVAIIARWEGFKQTSMVSSGNKPLGLQLHVDEPVLHVGYYFGRA